MNKSLNIPTFSFVFLVVVVFNLKPNFYHYFFSFFYVAFEFSYSMTSGIGGCPSVYLRLSRPYYDEQGQGIESTRTADGDY